MAWFTDEFAEYIFFQKYAGNYTGIIPFYKDLAHIVARDDRNIETRFYNLLVSKKFSPGGRILAYAGRPDAHVSLMNCTTHAIEGDTLEDISETAYTVMRASSRGQGIGVDLSALRPIDSPVNNAARSSTGAISFMEMLNAVGGTIGQEGRRAAMLFSIRDSHPDLWRPEDKKVVCDRCFGEGCPNCNNGYLPYDFLHVKRIPGKVENANISVMLSDKFMQAVVNNDQWYLHFEGNSGGKAFFVRKEVLARNLFSALSNATYASAEPGVLYWDTSKRKSNSDLFGEEWGLVGVNACLHQDTKISTEQGEFTVEELSVKDKLPKVYTYNEETKEVELSEIVWVKKTREDDTVITITFEDDTQLTLTPDHRVFTENRGWIIAAQLTEDDIILEMETITLKRTRIKKIEVAKNSDVYDISVKKNHNFFANKVLVHNCSEMLLDQDGVCNLGSMNLSAYIENPFTKNAYFNHTEFAADVGDAVEFLDNILDIELERHGSISKRQRESIIALRRIGLGVMGLADALAKLGMEYGSQESISTTEQIFRGMRNAAYKKSILLAKERGAAGVWAQPEEYMASIVSKGFFASLPLNIIEGILKYKTRNTTLLSVAPTGTISNLLGVSSGIEPLFARSFVRRTRMSGSDEFIDYVHPGVRQSRNNGLPDSLWKTAYEVSPDEHIAMQATAQEYVDQSISKTLNMPSLASTEDIANAYMNGWMSGLKGMAIYRDGSRDMQVLYADDAVSDEEKCPVCGSQVVYKEGCKECLSCEWAACSL